MKKKTEQFKQEIDNFLKEGKKPTEIANLLNLNPQTVTWWIKAHYPGITFIPKINNPNYFSIIDSYSKAYILGFIAADGALVNNGNNSIVLTITIKYEDKEVLEFIKKELGSNHSLQEIIRSSSYDPTKQIHHIRLALANKQLTSDIMKYGITFNKSLSMGNIILNIPYKYRDAFIIGYFDGDGSVTIQEGLHKSSNGYMCKNNSLYIQLRGTEMFFNGICEHLNISKTHIRTYDSISQLSFASKKDTYRFFQCYNNLTFYYKRKYNKFLQRINLPCYDKYKQVQTISSSIE